MNAEGMGSGTEVTREVSATQVRPGPGYIARVRNVVVWAEPQPGPGGAEALDVLVTGLRDIGEELLPGDEATARASMLLSDVRVAGMAGLAAVLPTVSGLVALAGGWGQVSGAAGGNGTGPDGTGEPTIRLIELIDETLVVGRRDIAEQLAGGPRDASVQPNERTTPAATGLVQGVVPGGAAVLRTRIAIVGFANERVRVEPSRDATPRAGVPGDPEADPTGGSADAQGMRAPEREVLALQGPDAPRPPFRAPLPMVGERSDEASPAAAAVNGSAVRIEGIECMRGHLNNPISLHCVSCGISLIKRSSDRVQGIRPALGVIVFDDGSTFALKSNFILGAAPDLSEAVLNGQAQGLRLIDPAEEIEPLHAEVRLDGWDVTLIDWSNRGTYILPEEAGTWQVAPRGVPTTLTAGTHIAIGRRTLVFDHCTRPVG